ncbi:hypothetical protein SAICODRAFT_7572 [Saitoella complicata NRRL Y-17804]|uniref:uncharacterized protein n=1 Tax=Saitoella complicata (strain BCRC 22490 / CBS 7301 / JCM 7358 / NBRC 10748 / NRRL Y-17804) TaxID=698492 RepID=UPI000866E23B|nr:uncharacterized protein SAICODRAFT_7572 [Saitoella complicata NRRL Y-17804]ODQ52972.1 hypothetical protein SAICODRAFT_7572 [Saitoella complicata NRRL Y-17804]
MTTINIRTLTAPICAFTMAILLGLYVKRTIRVTRADAQRGRPDTRPQWKTVPTAEAEGG